MILPDSVPEYVVLISLVVLSAQVSLYTKNIWQFSRISKRGVSSTTSVAGLSVIVPVRNEEDTIVNLLKDLERQEYNQFEVIIVNDESEDNTGSVVQSFAEGSDLAIILVDTDKSIEMAPKKRAVYTGVRQSSYDHIVTTDADCRLGPGWLLSIANGFDKDVNMVCGPVLIEDGKGLLSLFQYFEMAAVMHFSAVTMSIHRPTMINGANMAITKKEYLASGYGERAHHLSGDDTFLMESVFSRKPESVIYNLDPTGVVTTAAEHSLGDLINQRRRWASKWKDHKLPYVKRLALGIVTFNLNRILWIALFLSGLTSATLFAIAFIIPITFEAIMVRQLLQRYKRKFPAGGFLVSNILYPFYSLYMGIISQHQRYSWKGRKVGQRELAGNT